MKFLIAMMKHETNTFSPVPTDLKRFRDWGLQRRGGRARLQGHQPSDRGFLDVAADAVRNGQKSL